MKVAKKSGYRDYLIAKWYVSDVLQMGRKFDPYVTDKKIYEKKNNNSRKFP